MPASLERVTELLLVRHGETDWNRERASRGTPISRSTRRAAPRRARSPTSSPARRSTPSTRATSPARARRPRSSRRGSALEVVPLRELREIDVGEWQGLTWPRSRSASRRRASWHERGHGWDPARRTSELARARRPGAPADRRRAPGRARPGRRPRRHDPRDASVHRGRVRRRQPLAASRAIGNCEVFQIVVRGRHASGG